jgi:hypothetical protein
MLALLASTLIGVQYVVARDASSVSPAEETAQLWTDLRGTNEVKQGVALWKIAERSVFDGMELSSEQRRELDDVADRFLRRTGDKSVLYALSYYDCDPERWRRIEGRLRELARATDFDISSQAVAVLAYSGELGILTEIERVVASAVADKKRWGSIPPTAAYQITRAYERMLSATDNPRVVLRHAEMTFETDGVGEDIQIACLGACRARSRDPMTWIYVGRMVAYTDSERVRGFAREILGKIETVTYGSLREVRETFGVGRAVPGQDRPQEKGSDLPPEPRDR